MQISPSLALNYKAGLPLLMQLQRRYLPPNLAKSSHATEPLRVHSRGIDEVLVPSWLASVAGPDDARTRRDCGGHFEMTYLAVHRQYNDVVAPYYDRDPQELTGRSLNRALQQLLDQHVLDDRTGR